MRIPLKTADVNAKTASPVVMAKKMKNLVIDLTERDEEMDARLDSKVDLRVTLIVRICSVARCFCQHEPQEGGKYVSNRFTNSQPIKFIRNYLFLYFLYFIFFHLVLFFVCFSFCFLFI